MSSTSSNSTRVVEVAVNETTSRSTGSVEKSVKRLVTAGAADPSAYTSRRSGTPEATSTHRSV
jgi:hypothetical protein